MRDEGLTHNDWRRAVVELDDDEQIRQNLTMTSGWFSNSVGHACASLGIIEPDDNLYLDHLVGSPRGDVLPSGRQLWTTAREASQNFRSKYKELN
jgi:hypothetical protein